MTGLTLASLGEVDIVRLKGVAEKKRKALADAGITSLLDLLTTYPRRYLDRTKQASIGDLVVGEQATILARVRKVNAYRARTGRPMVDIDVSDGTSYLHCTFFNQPWRAKQVDVGTEVAIFGKLDLFRGRKQMANPVFDLVGNRTGRIIPVYPQSEKAGVVSGGVASAVDVALERLSEHGDLIDPLPPEHRDELHLVGRSWAMHQIHHPESWAAMEAARKRLAFDELFRLQTILVIRKRAVERDATGIRHRVSGDLVDRFRDRLPFPLTNAQIRAIAEIEGDLGGPHPMHRLLQGDVGAGKTVVAVAALLTAVQGGYQGALMAPTEVLAEQHLLGVSSLVAGLTVVDEGRLGGERPVTLGLLTHRTGAAARAKLHAALAAGGIDILIGTHALLTEAVDFHSLGVVVIDEQHRFGVEQRAALRQKGDTEAVPDVLVMTATPIPRTAAMTVYGDLDTTVMDELPPGRTPITTIWARPAPEAGDGARPVARKKSGAGPAARGEARAGAPPAGVEEVGDDRARPAGVEEVGDDRARPAGVKEVGDDRTGPAAGNSGGAWSAAPAEERGGARPGRATGGARPAGEAARTARGDVAEASAWERVKSEVAAGHQAYVVCPLVEESERVQARSATEELERLRTGELSGLRLGLLHGQLPARDKEAVMASFRAGEIDVLVATTVIEVGVDVVNATVMVIEDADRFGMAQLHQLRGRVGRGRDPSWCYLLGGGQTPESEARLLAVERSTDGFELAEVDLELRGEGTILGTRQIGVSDLKLASLRKDRDLVEAARAVAFAIVDSGWALGGGGLAAHPDLAAEIRALVDEDDRAFLFKS